MYSLAIDVYRDVVVRRAPGKLSNKGFSLIEIMVVVIVMSIIFGISAPVTEVLNDVRLNYQASRFLKTTGYAANEAIKRKNWVNICGSSTGNGCDAGGNSWPGWVVYLDTNNSGGFDAGEEILQFFRPSAAYPVQRATGNGDLAFNANGISNPFDDGTGTITSAATFWVCSSSTDDIVLEINATGRRFARHRLRQAVC